MPASRTKQPVPEVFGKSWDPSRFDEWMIRAIIRIQEFDYSLYMGDVNVDDNFREHVELELKRFFTMALYFDLGSRKGTCLYAPSSDILSVWKEMVLDTRKYTKFCFKVYGRYLHMEFDCAPQGYDTEFYTNYRALFREDPPASIWSMSYIR